MGDKIEQKIISTLQKSLKVEEFEKDYQLYQKKFLKSFVKLITQTLRQDHLALITGLMNARNHATGQAIMQEVNAEFNESLQEQNYIAVKLILRYYCLLLNANVILPNQLINIFDKFLEIDGDEQSRKDQFMMILMSSLPYATQLRDRNLMELERIYATVEEYVGQRSANYAESKISLVQKQLACYRDSAIDVPYIQKDPMDLLMSQLQDLKQNNWVVSILADPFKSYLSILGNQLQHELGQVMIPSSITPVKFSYQPKFWIFNDSVNIPGEKQLSHLPGNFTISRFILDDNVQDIVRLYYHNHKECAKLLLKLPTMYNQEFLRAQQYQVYEAVVEGIFAELFRFPTTKVNPVYYNTLVSSLCKESLDKIPSILGRSFKLLFSRLDGTDESSGMDIEGLKRFSDFFACHLANFGYSWKWSDWEGVLEANKNSGQYIFVRETLQKCIRLAYFDRIKNSIPENYEAHGDIFPTRAPTYNFMYADVQSSGDERLYNLVQILGEKISSREDLKDQISLIRDYVDSNASSLSQMAQDHELDSVAQIPHDALLQSLMFQGSKSFSHLLNVIESYLPLLQELNSTEEERNLSTRIVCNYWRFNSQFQEIILGKLVNYQVLDSKSVVSWVLSSTTLDDDYSKIHVWSILSSTLTKVTLKIEELLKRQENAQEDRDAMNGSEISYIDDGEGIQELLEITRKEKKDLFIFTFKAFTKLLNEKVAQYGPDVIYTAYWKWVSGHLRQTCRLFQADVDQLKFTIDALVFGEEQNQEILEIWQGMMRVFEIQD